MRSKARVMGANAVIAFHIDFNNIGSKGRSLIMAYAKGTAVVVGPSAPDEVEGS